MHHQNPAYTHRILFALTAWVGSAGTKDAHYASGLWLPNQAASPADSCRQLQNRPSPLRRGDNSIVELCGWRRSVWDRQFWLEVPSSCTCAWLWCESHSAASQGVQGAQLPVCPYAYGWSYTCRSAWCSAAFSLASATWGQHMSVPGLCMRSSSVLLGISSNSSWGIPVGDYTCLWCCVCARRILATCESICPDRLHCPLAAELCPPAGRTWWAGFLYWILS